MAQDFSGQNLQGRSFKGRTDLMGANFSYADIRGADFTNAILTGANFSYAQAGVQSYWATVLLIISLGLSTLSGFVSAFAGAYTGSALISQDKHEVLAGGFILITLVLFFTITIRQGLLKALGVGVVAVGLTAIAAVVAGEPTLAVTIITVGLAVVAAAIAMAVTAAVTTAGALAAAGAVTIVAAGAGVVAAAGAVVAITGEATAAAAVATIAVVVAMAVAGLSAYVSWQALAGNKKYGLIRLISVTLASMGGTSFRKADLTDADFTQAMLKSTDFREANLRRTCWFQGKKLDLARVGRTYLDNSQVRQLVVTGEGEESNFDGFSLRGINLRGANLVAASLVGTDLRDANLQSANLSRANLQHTKLDGTDLTGACLAGASIEEWGITSETKLDRVQRQYIFRLLAKKKEPRS
ncbi:MAG TPA: low-complexity protein [Cyanobacteria bacterium UBA11370]|nr:low-complexity protein [Cyanobacteria bacterium UBA11370]